MKFEYTTLDLEKAAPAHERADRRRSEFLKSLQGLGEEGWELVSVEGPIAFLKRAVVNGAPTTLAKVCSNCRCFQECAEKDASGQTFGNCIDWKMAVGGSGSCDRFAEKAYGQAEGQAAPYQPVGGRPTGQSAGPVPAGPVVRDSAGAPPDSESAWHWQPRTEYGEKRLEATTDQIAGVESPEHKHKVLAILDKDGKVVRGKTDMVNGHEHPVAINGMCEEADGHTHTYDPTPRG